MILNTKTELRKLLTELSTYSRMVFSVSTSENTVGNYIKWSQAEGKDWANPSLLQQVAQDMWIQLNADVIDVEMLSNFQNQIESVTPDTEQFRDASASGALDSPISIIFAIRCIIGQGTLDDAVECGVHALFSSDILLSYRNKIASLSLIEQEQFEKERLIDSTYHLAREWERQQKVIGLLKNKPKSKLTRVEFYELVKSI